MIAAHQTEERRETVIGLHIPKTGGMTLRTFVVPNFQSDHFFEIAGGRYVERLEELRLLDDAKKASLRLVLGHLPYGVHEWLPRPCRYFTMLRDPVDRVLSHYYYVLEQPTHPLHERVVSSSMSLEEYVTSGLSAELSNGQTRLLCGWPEIDSLRGDGECTQAVFEAARKNLEQVAAVGLMEEFNRSLELYRTTFGWAKQPIQRRNVTKKRSAVDSHSAETLRVIRDRNSFDLALYEHARQLFASQCLERSIPKEVHVEEKAPVHRPEPSPFRRIFSRAFGGLRRTFRG